MGTNELAKALGVSKALVSGLAKRGMPLTSVQAAQAWRESNAKPRQWKAKPATDRIKSIGQKIIPPLPDIKSAITDDPDVSLTRAREAEDAAFLALRAGHDADASPEDIRKLSATYFASRSNRQKAEVDNRQKLRIDGITLFTDEARELISRPHVAAKQLMESMPKTLAPRLHGQPQKAIEATLAAWCDNLTEIIRKAI